MCVHVCVYACIYARVLISYALNVRSQCVTPGVAPWDCANPEQDASNLAVTKLIIQVNTTAIGAYVEHMCDFHGLLSHGGDVVDTRFFTHLWGCLLHDDDELLMLKVL